MLHSRGYGEGCVLFSIGAVPTAVLIASLKCNQCVSYSSWYHVAPMTVRGLSITQVTQHLEL